MQIYVHSIMKKNKKNLKVTPTTQTGHICKPTAIATIDHYYAKQEGFQAISLNKHNNPLHQRKKNLISMRELAKKQDSVQGELLEMRQVNDIFHDIGYETIVIDFTDKLNLFKETIITSINAGNLIFAAFSVDRKSGAPTTQPDDLVDKNEHVAVIHGYDEEKDTVLFTHWGKERTCTFQEFYDSSMVLLKTRQPEYYKNVKTIPSLKKYAHQLGAFDDGKLSCTEKTGCSFLLMNPLLTIDIHKTCYAAQ